MNARWGRWDNFWTSDEASVTTLLDRHTIIQKLAYSAANPVKDYLVERVHHWPGVNSYTSLLNKRVLRARKPHFFFRPDGPMPDEVTLELVIPPELGDADEVLQELQACVEQIERDTAEERKRTGRSIVGRRRILKESWRSSPSSPAPRRGLRPRFAGLKENRVPALLAFREFLTVYKEARHQWLAGADAQFPRGTYWLGRFAAVTVASEKNN